MPDTLPYLTLDALYWPSIYAHFPRQFFLKFSWNKIVLGKIDCCPMFGCNKTPKVVSVGCVGLWKHNGVLSRLMEQNKTKHPLALSRVEPRVTKFDKVPMF